MQQNMRRKPSRAVLTGMVSFFTALCITAERAPKISPTAGKWVLATRKADKTDSPTPEPLVASALLCPLA
jgi:hypothetical protein